MSIAFAADLANLAITTSVDDSELRAAIDSACNRVAPLWPLKNFVAVNPFLGFSDQSFEATCAIMRRVNRTHMLMPRSFYRSALEAGDMLSSDLEAALIRAPRGWNPPATTADLFSRLEEEPVPRADGSSVVATIAEILDRLAAGNRQVSRTEFMITEISKWCAAYFDQGQAVWRAPWRDLPIYAAWRQAMRHDCNPETLGIRNFRASVARLPSDPVAAIGVVVSELGIPSQAVADYLYRALFDVRGWAGYVRHRTWKASLDGTSDDALVHLLAIRLVWGYALFLSRSDAALAQAWEEAMRQAAAMNSDDDVVTHPDLVIDLILQAAYEHACQRQLIADLTSERSPCRSSVLPVTRRPLQAAFCIDVRSEVFRRALEAVYPDVETFGFAGFFGLPIEYIPIGNSMGNAQCPVLLKPRFVVCETVDGATPNAETAILNKRRLRRRAAKAWKAFKQSAISSFTFVETAGLGFAGKLASDSFGLTRPATDPNTDGLDPRIVGRVGPRIDVRTLGGRQTGFDSAQRVEMAEAILRAMSMTGPFARLIILTGHGSTTVNNPHASGLDCGACGGHTGEANARVAAAILNDPIVRKGLAKRGIEISDDTWFLGCLHDTTTDDVQIFEVERIPQTHAAELDQLRSQLAEAAKLARAERAPSLKVQGKVEPAIRRRTRDWAQLRPEWGLAGNAAFIVGPRALTQGVDLGGQAFLHTYDWRQDHEFRVLELIMTAPMVVASWINLQYYGSTVNNAAFGAGNKVLHNVVGTLGVLEGNGGDLRTGLPWQSLHDGRKLVHKPVRINVFIAAPLDAINQVIAAHAGVRDLVNNHWIHLFALPEDRRLYRYIGDLAWESAR